MSDIFCGKGTQVSYDDYMALINRVFGFTTPEQMFEGLLPKLYQPHLKPQDSSYVVTEDGQVVAAVGAYDHQIRVCGVDIPCRGIGNVAVAPETRGKGYMISCMNAALQDMVKDGIALSTLGGRRQRYQYFGYDKAGPAYTFYVTSDNLRHTYGTTDAPFDTFVQVQREDTQTIAQIKALCDTGRYAPQRDSHMFVDIAETWHAKLYAVSHEGQFKGYCILEPSGTISEIKATAPQDFMPLLRTIFAGYNNGGMSVRLPVFDDAYARELVKVADGGNMCCSMCYNVLNYALILQAFFNLKATYTTLADGELTLLVHGFARDERLRISVKEGVACVQTLPDESPVNYEWSHLEATEMLFSPISPSRADLPLFARDWFPLPLWMYRADEV